MKSTRPITKKLSRLFTSFWAYLKQALRSKLITSALKRLFGSAALGGLKGAVLAYIAGHLYDELVVPFIDFLERKGMLFVDTQKGKIKIQRLEAAKESHDENAYNDAVDSL